jgi:uncharacterized protein with GYD domain
MPIFVLMTRLAPESVHDVRSRRAMGKEWLQRVGASCPGVRWLAHYAILGPYDFMDIYEAPDVETAHTVSMLSRAGGAVTAESWQLMEYDDYMKLLEKVS